MPTPDDPEVALAIGYAPRRRQSTLAALWAFDAKLAAILRTTHTPLIGQMRLTWWHNAVADAPAGEPVLAAVRDAGFDPSRLQRIVEGWEALLDEPDDAALQAYASGRGGGLFGAAADLLEAPDETASAGTGWALVDLARHHSVAAVASRALALAGAALAQAPHGWSRRARSLGALAKLARRDVAGLEAQGSPRRILAAATLALTGR